MYRIKYTDSTIFDPYDDDEVVTDAKLTQEVNAAAYLDFTISPKHPLYDTVKERDGVVTLEWLSNDDSEEDEKLFEGIIDAITIDFYGYKEISCVSAMDYLNDTIVRPYSTVAGEQALTAPSSIEGYFQWLIDQHNAHVLDSKKRFGVGINQGANLRRSDFIYRSSTNNPTTSEEISNQIIESLGGYLVMRYDGENRLLDLYADVHEMNAQIIDFGVNLLDFTKTIDTADQYTALIPKGGSPTFEDGGFEDDDSVWTAYPYLNISTDQKHGGEKSAYFTEGNGEFINKSFLYVKSGYRYKATVWVRNERSSSIKVYPRYQVFVGSQWETRTPDGVNPLEVPNDNEWHEFTFDFLPSVSDTTKIRGSWVFDTVTNDNNKRVYVDDFNFVRIQGENELEEDPITVAQMGDGTTPFSYDIVKHGDVIYSMSAVQRYGYREKVFSDDTITDEDALMEEGIRQLNKCMEPTTGIDIKAVDLAMYMKGYTHLQVGQAVRIRSVLHDTDEYLMVTSVDLDLQDPSQTEYELGMAYDSLTGKQSSYLQSLNVNINSSLDAVASLDQASKENAIHIGEVESIANDAQNTANNAQNTANNAQNTANANKEAIDSIKDAQTEYEKQLEQMQQGVADATEGIGQVNDRIEGMNSEIESAKSDIDSLRSSTETELQNVKQSVSKVQSDVDSVSKKAEDLASDLDGTKAKVEQVTTDLGEVKTTVSNAATKADQALQVSTSASQTATEAKTTATSAYQDAQSALTQSSTASQTANAVKTELETKYSTTDEIAEQYATKSLVEQTSQSITSTVEATYATKATVEALENIANNAVQTWMGSGVPTLSNKPASDWTTAELKSQHSGDIYYDSDTGYSYRFGSSDGKNYSWSLIKDTDISKAVADAAKAQQTAEGVSDEVTQLKTDIPATYATKTEVKQTTDSIKSTVSEVASTANSALSKATTVEQTANGLRTTVTEQAEKLDGAVTTISQVSQRVDSVSSTITQVQGDVNAALSQSYLTNPDFETGDTTGWDFQGFSKVEVNSASPATGTYKVYVQPDGSNAQYIFNKKKFPVSEGQKYRITLMMNTDTASTNPMNFGLVQGGYTDFNHSVYFTKTPTGIGYRRYETVSGTVTIPSGWKTAQFRFSTQDQSYTTMRLDSFSIVDVTEGSNAQSTANSALSQSSTVQQELTSFKTSVQQTYETKNDALSKQSSLQQSVNNLRTEVSETYTTKTAFEALNDAATKTYQFHSNNNSTGWYKLGKWTGTDQGDICAITIYAGAGQNARAYQNREMRVYIKDSYQSTPGSNGAFGVTIDRIRNADAAEVQVRATASNACEVWYKAETTYAMGRYVISIDPDTIWMHSGAYQTSAPTSGTLQPQEYQTYSTKSYVDQTARTVSLGVVEEYKDGQHGSALATQSDITAAEDSITSTVSQTYATKNDVGVGNLIKNGDFSDGSSNWMTVGGTSKIVDGTYGKQFVFTQTGTNTNGNNRIYNPSYNHINGQAYEVSFYAKADKSSKWHFGPNNSSKAASVTLDTTLKQYTMQYQADTTTVLSVWTDNPTATIYLERVKLSIASGYYATKTEVKQTSDSLTVTISSAMSKAESAATAASNAQNTANTAKNNAASAQSTANTANSNAQNANNRVGNLETCIKMTSDGVRVGKISNGNFVGYSALVNSEGSFDILNASGGIASRFSDSMIELGKNNSTATISMLNNSGNIVANTDGLNISSPKNVQLTAGGENSGQTLTVKGDGVYYKNRKIFPPFNVLEKQIYSDIKITAYSYAGFVSVNVRRWSGGGVAWFPPAENPSIIGKVNPDYAPRQDVDVLVGIQGNAWLELTVRTNGDIGIYALYSPNGLNIESFGGLVSYLAKNALL